MYVNVTMTHYRLNEEGDMEPDPEIPVEHYDKVFLAKVGSSRVTEQSFFTAN